MLQSLIYFSITRKLTIKRTGLAPATTLNFYKYNAVTRNPPKVELEYQSLVVSSKYRIRDLLWVLFFMVVTEKQAGKRPTIMGFPLMKTPRKESEKTECAVSSK